MKNKIKFALVFACGLLIGVVATFIILGQLNILRFRDYYLISAKEQVFIASELRANRQRELQDRAEGNLPGIVLAIHNDRQLRAADNAHSVLQEVKHFYESNSLPIPAEISGILSSLPNDH